MIPTYNLKYCEAWNSPQGSAKRSRFKGVRTRKAFESSPSTRPSTSGSKSKDGASNTSSASCSPVSKSGEYVGKEMAKLDQGVPLYLLDFDKLEAEVRRDFAMREDLVGSQGKACSLTVDCGSGNNKTGRGNGKNECNNHSSSSSTDSDQSSIFNFAGRIDDYNRNNNSNNLTLSYLNSPSELSFIESSYRGNYTQNTPSSSATSSRYNLFGNLPPSPSSYVSVQMAADKADKERARVEAAEYVRIEKERISLAIQQQEDQKSLERTMYMSKQRKLRSAKGTLKAILEDIPVDKAALKRQLDIIKDITLEMAKMNVPSDIEES